MMKLLKRLLLAAMAATIHTSCQPLYTSGADGVASLGSNGYRLPAEIGPLKRTYIKSLDSGANQIGAGYDCYSGDFKAALTVYILPAGSRIPPTAKDRERHFQDSRREVLSAHKNPVEIRSTTVVRHGSNGSLSEFRYDQVFAHTPQRVASFLAVFSEDNCLIKFRITGPEDQRARIHASLLQAIHTLTEMN